MRKILAVLAVAALMVPVAHGAGGLGVYYTDWDAEDGEDQGMGGGIKFKMEMMPQIMLELRATYLQGFFESGSAFEDLIMAPLEADIVVDFPLVPDVLNIYGGGGGGYYLWPEFESEIGVAGSDQPDIDPDDEFGYFVVGGVELQLNEQLKIFGEAKMNWVEMEGVEQDDVDFDFEGQDIDFGGLSYNAGLLLMW